METLTDLVTWLEAQEGVALVSDDAGHWAVTGTGFQTAPTNPPQDMTLTFAVEAHEWMPSIQAAIHDYKYSDR